MSTILKVGALFAVGNAVWLLLQHRDIFYPRAVEYWSFPMGLWLLGAVALWYLSDVL